ncbi:MAG: anaerobic sulfatase maturase [Lachnospiraceae bacterium]
MPALSLLIKPASGNCNMRCRYCFYADELDNREIRSYGKMSVDTMHTIVDKAMEYGDYECTIAFQGGEPTLAGLDFYRDLVAYVTAHENPKKLKIHYALQTNGYLINEEWAAFLGENHFLVGVSLDGLKEIHDRYRLDAAGKGTYQRVISAIRLLEKHQVEYNILTVVTAATARNGQKIYNYFKKNHFGYQQYIECLDPIGEEPGQHEYSLTPEKYGEFLKSMFDAWYLDMRSGTYVYNRYFENLMMIMAGQQPESCNMRGVCGKQWVFEADGSVYPCDFYALDQWRLGNIQENSFEEMDEKRDELGFIQWSMRQQEDCQKCRWFGLCRNGCRRNREPVTAEHTNRNYFCKSYQMFFEYAYPRLEEIYQLYMAGRIRK